MTVSGQLNLEAFCLAFSDVYTFGPAFRAEKSNTPRHLAELWMVEPEIAFADLDDNIRLAEDLIKYVIAGVFAKAKEELEFLNEFVDKGLIERLKTTLEKPFARVTYTEAIEIMVKSGQKFEYPVKWGSDIQTEHERYLSEKHFGRPVFVTDYPKEIKSFYMRQNDDGKTVAAVDLLVPEIGELVGGSQREERLELLEQRMKELDLNEEAYWWYTNLRRYGSVKHSGFGLGLERLVRYITGMANIRDVIPFPRTSGNAEF
jgi:asparaginyl-tRNA synthetase